MGLEKEKEDRREGEEKEKRGGRNKLPSKNIFYSLLISLK